MSVNMSMIGRLTKDARVMVSNNNPETELLYMTLAVDTYGYKDKQTGQWVQKTEYYDVQLRFKKGAMDGRIKNNMFAKGHKVSVKDVVMLQRDPKVHNGKAYANNLFVLLPTANIYTAIEFIDYPHAISSNSSQPAPKQSPQQSAAQQAQMNQGADAGNKAPAQSQQAQYPEPPVFDPDDDIPF